MEGKSYEVIISDETDLLMQAKRENKATIGLLTDGIEQDFSHVSYAVESMETIDPVYLERVVRRYLKMPWMIAKTERVIIREFCITDLPEVPVFPTDTDADKIFQDEKRLEAYIHHQYGLFEYGIWALIETHTGTLIGKAGISNLSDTDQIELGYHIFPAYQRMGYAKEVCSRILSYAKEELDIKTIHARIDPSNEGSLHLAQSLGFLPMERKYNQLMPDYVQYVLNLR